MVAKRDINPFDGRLHYCKFKLEKSMHGNWMVGVADSSLNVETLSTVIQLSLSFIFSFSFSFFLSLVLISFFFLLLITPTLQAQDGWGCTHEQGWMIVGNSQNLAWGRNYVTKPGWENEGSMKEGSTVGVLVDARRDDTLSEQGARLWFYIDDLLKPLAFTGLTCNLSFACMLREPGDCVSIVNEGSYLPSDHPSALCKKWIQIWEEEETKKKALLNS